MATSLDGVVATDEHGIVIGWNRNAESIFGHTALEALQQPMDGLIIPTNARSAHNHGMNRYLTTGGVHILGKRVNVTALHKEGHVFPVELAVMVTTTIGKLRSAPYCNKAAYEMHLEERHGNVKRNR